MVRVDRSALRYGEPVRVLARVAGDITTDSGSDWVVSVGKVAPGHEVWIADESGERLGDGVLGEIVLTGPSVAQAITATPTARPGSSATNYAPGTPGSCSTDSCTCWAGWEPV